MTVRTATTAALLALAAIVGGCQNQDTQADATAVSAGSEGQALTAAMTNFADLSISARLIDHAQLGSALDGNGSYTVFAPVDAAWAKLDPAELKALEGADGRPQLVAVLRQHIAPGYVLGADLDQALARNDAGATLATMGAGPVTLRREGGSVLVGEGDGAPRIVGAPIVAGNDVIYRVDGLIPPPE